MPIGFGPRLESLCQFVPGVVIHLLEPKRDSLLIRVDAQDNDLDLFALPDDFGRMLHPPGPTHIRDMDQSIDPRFNLDERTEGGQIPHHSADLRSRRVLGRKCEPRIFLRLLHAERDLLLFFINTQHDALEFVVDRRQLRGMAHVSSPAHLGNVHQALDPLLQLDKGTVVGDRYDAPANPASDRVLGGYVLPRIGLKLLETQRDPLAIPIDVEDLDLDFVPDLTEFGRMADPPPGHIGNVQKAVHPP